TCESSPCNRESEVCVDTSGGAVCKCAPGYVLHDGICTGTCAVIRCGSGEVCMNIGGIGT
ncbi:unnamed protein product, partial [Closterium sp. Naga37s-1]